MLYCFVLGFEVDLPDSISASIRIQWTTTDLEMRRKHRSKPENLCGQILSSDYNPLEST